MTISVRAPLTTNHTGLSKKLKDIFGGFFGPGKVLEYLPRRLCEDFPRLATAANALYVFWFVGKEDLKAVRRAREEDRSLDAIPINHSPFNAPLIHPTLETAVHALSLAALSVLLGT